jgi:hypothetical protein
MRTKITLTYCGMTGEGPTVREAKQDAARKIEAALELNYTPSVFAWKGRTALVWNTPTGVCSAYVADNGIGTSGVCMHGLGTSIEAACISVRMSLAQAGADITSDEIPAILGKDKGAITHFQGWLGFQRAYRQAQADGLCEVDAHRFACEQAGAFAPKGGQQ